MKADEALGQTAEERRAERRRRAVTGPLPESFLRVPGREEEGTVGEEERDREIALQLQRELALEGRTAAASASASSRSGSLAWHAERVSRTPSA